MRSEDQLLANKSTRRSRGLLFDNNWSSDRIINLSMFEFISKKISDIKILYKIIKKKNSFYQIIAHVRFREILSCYFLFSHFDWSIFVTQLVAKHMKEIITKKKVCGQRKIFVINSFVNGRLIITTIKGTHSLHWLVL
jgi:hypothetical protein